MTGETGMPPKGEGHSPQSTSDADYRMFALKIVGDFGASIALPVVAFALLGKHLDQRWGTRPWLLIAGFALAAVISGTLIYRRANRYGQAYQQLVNRESKPKS